MRELTKDYLALAQLPHQKKIKSNPYRNSGSVQQPHPENQVTGIAKATTLALVHYVKSGVNTTEVHLLGNNN